MTVEIFTVLATVVCAFIVFVKEWLPVDVVGVLIILVLILTGTLDIATALQGFGHPAVIGVGALFIVSEALLRTGALGILVNRLEAWSRGEELRLKVYVLGIVAASSAFLNNTPVVAMFIPVVLRLSRRMEFNPSRLLMPLSFAAILGGTCTLIGTSTNIMVASLVTESLEKDPGLPVRSPLMFDFARLGALLAGTGLVYLLFFSQRLLPERQTISSMTATRDRRLREYVTELAIRPGGSLVGQAFENTVLATTSGIRILQLIRGETILWPPLADLVLQPGDTLVTAGRIQDLMELRGEEDLQSLDEILAPEHVSLEGRDTELAEILIQPNSAYVGKTLEEAQLRQRFRLNVLAIQRHGMHLRNKLSEHQLRVGDLLLVQGTELDLHRVAGEEGMVLMSEVNEVLVRRDKAPLALVVLLGVTIALSIGLPMAAIALGGAMAMVLTGCLTAGKIYEAIHWRVLVLIAGTLALGHAMQATGTDLWLAGGIVGIFDFGGPQVLLVVTLVLTTLLTECVSNTAVAAIMIPVALGIAGSLGVSGTPFVMAVAYGASCSFLTPIGYQTNTLVYGAGGYTVTDFMRVGAPLVLIVWTLGGTLIPVFWSF